MFETALQNRTPRLAACHHRAPASAKIFVLRRTGNGGSVTMRASLDPKVPILLNTAALGFRQDERKLVAGVSWEMQLDATRPQCLRLIVKNLCFADGSVGTPNFRKQLAKQMVQEVINLNKATGMALREIVVELQLSGQDVLLSTTWVQRKSLAFLRSPRFSGDVRRQQLATNIDLILADIRDANRQSFDQLTAMKRWLLRAVPTLERVVLLPRVHSLWYLQREVLEKRRAFYEAIFPITAEEKSLFAKPRRGHSWISQAWEGTGKGIVGMAAKLREAFPNEAAKGLLRWAISFVL